MANDQIPAGWYPDPAGDVTKIRYWDGQAWTEQTQDAQNVDPRNSYNVPIVPQPVYAVGEQGAMYGGSGAPVANNGRDKFAIAALVLGIVSIVGCCCSTLLPFGIFGAGVLGVLAIVFGVLGLKSARKGMAIAGLILGIIMVLLFVALIILAFTIVPDIVANPQNYGLPADYWEDFAESLGYERDYFENIF